MSRKALSEIAENWTEPEYRAQPELSYSTLSKFERGGRFNSLPTLFDSVSTPSLTFGSLVDTLITGGEEEFHENFLVQDNFEISDSLKQIGDVLYSRYKDKYQRFEEIPDAILSAVGEECDYYKSPKYANLRIKNIRQEVPKYYRLKQIAESKQVVSQADVDDARRCVDALRTSVDTCWYFAPNNPFDDNIERYYQLKFKGKDSSTGVGYRCMADLLIVLHDEKRIIPCDLKTSSHNEWDFPYSFIEWGYMWQAQLYSRIIWQNMQKDDYYKDFSLDYYRFIVINRKNLQPAVWEFPQLFDIKGFDFTYSSGMKRHFRDVYEIGEELNYYLAHPEVKMPRECTEINNIIKFLEK